MIGAMDEQAHLKAQSQAEVHRIEHFLRSYGVLTRGRLAELCGADRWHDPAGFDGALLAAVRAGRVRALTDQLYELAPEQ